MVPVVTSATLVVTSALLVVTRSERRNNKLAANSFLFLVSSKALGQLTILARQN